jgi:hypothetical protein
MLVSPLAHDVGDYSGGRSCSSSLPMSGEFKGSSPSQSKHRYLRPRIPFTSANFIGLWHFGQIGGSEAFMARTFCRAVPVVYAPERQL